jgi:hypothetical protein
MEALAIGGSCAVLGLGIAYARFLLDIYRFIKEDGHVHDLRP